jgi:tetratricopeptide (TPR) repeat protein/mono/diheme cytochrome c family protein
MPLAPAGDRHVNPKVVSSKSRRQVRIVIWGLLVLSLGVTGWGTYFLLQGPLLQHTVTFNRDIAPLVFQNCAACHRPGEAAPFPLLSYEDVRQRAEQIVEVTHSRFMPPWLPKQGYGEFVGERRLTDAQIELFARWVEQGTVRGDPSDLPAVPEFNAGWQLGEPDLVTRMPEAYTLQAEGTDVFRNFVLPIPIESSRFVKAVELRPGNNKVMHHANMLVDQTGDARRLDQQEPEPGFGGMENLNVAQRPSGHFLSWKIGTPTFSGAEEKAWRLDVDTDLMVNMHMLPSGKPEQIQAEVGFYFTDTPPSEPPLALLQLERDSKLDIPAGKQEFVVTDTFQLPVDVEVLAVYPHAHLLGKDLQGYALLPDGRKKWLIWIEDWDWNWQAVYRYAKPLSLPKGTTLTMRYTYDNSIENVRNPNHPPQRVVAGNRTEDEMAHLWVQVLPRNNEDLHLFNEGTARHQLLKYPNNIERRVGLGIALTGQGRLVEATDEFREVIRVRPDHANAHYNLGCVLRLQKQLDEASEHFEQALRVKPHHAEAHNNLAIILHEQGRFQEAVGHYREALRIRPNFALTHNNLGLALQSLGRFDEAAAHYQKALQLKPDHAAARRNLRRIQSMLEQENSTSQP